MNQLLQDLLQQLKTSSLAAKTTAALVGVALVVVAVVAGVAAREPHFELLYSGLDDQQSAAIQRALAEGGMEFEVSQPPGPYVIYVARDARYSAQNLVASSGALELAPQGIPGSESGLSTVFMSSSEREQMVRKREWEETEGMLEDLEFVARARVRTSASKPAAFGRRDPVSASVTLQLVGSRDLGREQADSVANLVRFALGVEREHLVIADQNGRTVFDGSTSTEDNVAEDWIAFLEDHDRGLEVRVNEVLAESLGDDRARVVLRSQWDFDEVHTRSERTENTKAIVSEDKRTTKTPQGGPATPAGGPAGTASNVSSGAFGVDQAGVAQPGAGGSPVIAETSDNRTEYVPSWTSTESRRVAPRLERLSVSLFLDEELGDRQSTLEEVVKAAVGFDESRGDVLRSMPIEFPLEESAPGAAEVAPAEGAPAAEGAGEEVLDEGGSLLETLLSSGVEIVAALAFVIVLIKSLRSARSGAQGPGGAESAPSEPDVDPESLARARVDEMLIQDPERVGEILSTWAKKEVSRSA